MYRITQNLFEDIQKVTSGVSAQEQQTPVEESQVDKAHFCATHVEHALLGYGECISEDHAKPDEEGNIAWYNVKFPVGIHKVESNQLRVVEGKSHTHGKKMAEESEEIEEAKKPNDGNLANNYPPYDKVTRGDVIAGRLGKDQMGGKKKVKEAVSNDDLHPAGASLLKHIKPQHRNLYKPHLTTDVFNGSYKDRTDVLNAAKKAGHLVENEEVEEAVEKTMGRAAKGYEKYGKEGMQALSKAGKEGKNLDKVRDKYNKYDDKLTKEDVAEAKDMSAFDWKSKVKAPQSSFASKKIYTGTVYTKKYKAEPDDADDADDMKKNKKNKGMDEGVTQTIINHNDFVLEVTDNPTFKDYFNAIQAIVPSSNEEIQKELVTIATEAYNEGYDDIILESMIRVGFEDRINNYRKQGYSVIAENYVPDADEPYVEYTLEKDGDTIQYVHTGKVFLSNDE